MKCFFEGKMNENNSFLKSLEQYDRELNLDSDNIVFVTKETICNFSDIDINLVLLTNIPSFEEFREYSLKYPNKIKAYVNLYAHENHFPQIVQTIVDGKMWLTPSVKKIVDEVLANKSNIS